MWIRIQLFDCMRVRIRILVRLKSQKVEFLHEKYVLKFLMRLTFRIIRNQMIAFRCCELAQCCGSALASVRIRIQGAGSWSDFQITKS
jgi:hypothetical protein